jgi:hypothetical protein
MMASLGRRLAQAAASTATIVKQTLPAKIVLHPTANIPVFNRGVSESLFEVSRRTLVSRVLADVEDGAGTNPLPPLCNHYGVQSPENQPHHLSYSLPRWYRRMDGVPLRA